MFCDIVFPQENEKSFVETADRLGTEMMAFAYPFRDRKDASLRRKRIEELQKTAKVRLGLIFEAEGKTIYKVHDAREKALAKGNEDSRETITRYKPDVIYDLELSENKDFAKFRNSGLDGPTCQIAGRNKVIAAISFSSFLNSSNVPLLLGRTVQNVKLCHKNRVRTAIASFALSPEEMRSSHDLKSFLLAIGMHTGNAKKSVEAVSEMLEQRI